MGAGQSPDEVSLGVERGREGARRLISDSAAAARVSPSLLMGWSPGAEGKPAIGMQESGLPELAGNATVKCLSILVETAAKKGNGSSSV